MTASSSRSAGSHPLDPLTCEEIERAVAAMRDAGIPDSASFVAVSPAEPEKDDFAGSVASGQRHAEVVVAAGATTIEAVVDLNTQTVITRRELTGVQAPMTVDEFIAVERAVRENPRFIEAARRRGVDDMSLVDIDPISVGYHGQPYEDGTRRLARVLAYVRPSHPAATPTPTRWRASSASSTSTPASSSTSRIAIRSRSRRATASTGPRIKRELRDDVRPIHDHPARGPELHGRRVRGPLAEVEPARRLQHPRGARAARGRLRGRRTACGRSSIARRSPRWSCRTPTRIASTSHRSTSASSTSAR